MNILHKNLEMAKKLFRRDKGRERRKGAENVLKCPSCNSALRFAGTTEGGFLYVCEDCLFIHWMDFPCKEYLEYINQHGINEAGNTKFKNEACSPEFKNECGNTVFKNNITSKDLEKREAND